MPHWLTGVADPLWRNAPAIVPMALAAAIFCRWAPCRPATRHAVWVTVLLVSLVIPFAPDAPINGISSTLLKTAGAPVGLPLVDPGSHGRQVHREQEARFAADPRPPAAPADEPAPADDEYEFEFVERSDGSEFPNDTKPEFDIKSEIEIDVEPEPVLGGFAFEIAPATALLFDRYQWFDVEVDPDACSMSPAESSDELLLAHERSRAEPARVVDAGASPTSSSFGERDVERTASAPATPSGSATRPSWAAWVAGLRQVRDAIGRLPAMPVSVWITGMLTLLALQVSATVVAWLRVRRSVPASAPVTFMVRLVADELGLATPPCPRFVDEAVSPMVFRWPFLRRSWLILPRRLWAELDPRGQRAIVCHELAHLRRGDHWFHAGQLLIGALYWWHPVVWWIRRRLSDESERCCDAWVTWLMPESRRAYAEALLSAKQFVGDRRSAMPSGGMALTRAGAKRFARRITNVMTERNRPGLSAASVLVVATLALTAWISRPAWACPDEEKAKAESAAPVAEVIVVPAPDDSDDTFTAHMRTKAGATPHAIAHPRHPHTGAPPVVAPAPPMRRSTTPAPSVLMPSTPLAAGPIHGPPPGTPVAVVAPSMTPLPARTPVLWLGGGADEDEGDEDLEARLERLERQMERLMQMMERQAAGGRGSGVSETPAPPRPREPREPREPRTPRAPRAEAGEVIQRPYALPEGKLEALIGLMSRDDVPVLISPGEGQIIVHGTEEQHRVFRAFVDLIHPEGAEGHDQHADHDHDGADGRGAHLHQRAIEQLRAAEEAYRRGLGAQNFEADSIRLRQAVEQYRHALDAARAGAVESLGGIESLKKELQRIERDRARVLRELKQLKQRTQKREMSDAEVDERRALEEQELAMAEHSAELAAQIEALKDQAASLEAEAQLLARQAENAAIEADSDAASDQAR